MTASIWRSSSGVRPMWRAMNSPGFSRSCRAGWLMAGQTTRVLQIRELPAPARRAQTADFVQGFTPARGRVRVVDGRSVLAELGVGRFVHQRVQLAGVGQLELEEP